MRWGQILASVVHYPVTRSLQRRAGSILTLSLLNVFLPLGLGAEWTTQHRYIALHIRANIRTSTRHLYNISAGGEGGAKRSRSNDKTCHLQTMCLLLFAMERSGPPPKPRPDDHCQTPRSVLARLYLLVSLCLPVSMEALHAVKQFRLRELAAALKTLPDASAQPKIPNPFLPRKNPESGRWAPAKYSHRRQAELIKHAKATNTLHLLPPGPKLGLKQLATAVSAQGASVNEELWAQEVEWEGEVKEKEYSGIENGSRLYANRRRMFKGHKWERTRQAREEERCKAMEHMDRRIVGFREVRLLIVHICIIDVLNT